MNKQLKQALQLLKVVETHSLMRKDNSMVAIRRKCTAMRALGEYMQEIRISAGLTATEVADTLGITCSHLRDMEKGNRTYLIHHIKNLLEY